MRDVIVITTGIVGIASSLLYELLLLAYRADKRTPPVRPRQPRKCSCGINRWRGGGPTRCQK